MESLYRVQQKFVLEAKSIFYIWKSHEDDLGLFLLQILYVMGIDENRQIDMQFLTIVLYDMQLSLNPLIFIKIVENMLCLHGSL